MPVVLAVSPHSNISLTSEITRWFSKTGEDVPMNSTFGPLEKTLSTLMSAFTAEINPALRMIEWATFHYLRVTRTLSLWSVVPWLLSTRSIFSRTDEHRDRKSRNKKEGAECLLVMHWNVISGCFHGSTREKTRQSGFFKMTPLRRLRFRSLASGLDQNTLARGEAPRRSGAVSDHTWRFRMASRTTCPRSSLLILAPRVPKNTFH